MRHLKLSHNKHDTEKTNIDYKKHYDIPFGTYVLANHDTTPQTSNESCMIGAIYLMTKDYGRHELMNKHYVKPIKKRTVLKPQ